MRMKGDIRDDPSENSSPVDAETVGINTFRIVYLSDIDLAPSDNVKVDSLRDQHMVESAPINRELTHNDRDRSEKDWICPEKVDK